MKVWDQAGIKLTIPGPAVGLATDLTYWQSLYAYIVSYYNSGMETQCNQIFFIFLFFEHQQNIFKLMGKKIITILCSRSF